MNRSRTKRKKQDNIGVGNKSAQEAIHLAELQVKKLNYIGICSSGVMQDLENAVADYQRGSYDSARKYATRATKTADSLKTAYKDACIALASASDCIRNLKEQDATVESADERLREARQAFEESDFERAYRYAVDAALVTVGSLDMNISGERKTSRDGKGDLPKICKWRIPQHTRGASVCLNMLGRNYRKPCADDFCEFIDNSEN